ncbi:terminase small subunit [Fimbriiglobus ruber]|uniref:Phage terminase, small subunit n=1 Tax=Fimbriiglobus ruber TaxID=1908690 RepID=A0A225E1E0_9BACT|nr:terminase small subunit [Fimbriiglobus ruber]OWK42177.1 Phage terminase, small subunit [Fimbriiglobus ruber]
MSHELTPKQEAFALKYVELGNASEAYRQSYDAENMLPKSVWEEASRTLSDLKVAARIMELQELHQKRHAVTVDRVLKEYAKLAFLDIRKAFDETGNLIPIHELDDDTAAAISGIEVDKKVSKITDENGEPMVESYLHKIKLCDKKGALDSIARHLGMFVDKTEITGKDGSALAPNSVSLTVTPDLVKSIVQQVRDEF